MKYTNKYNLPASYVDVINKLTYDLSETDPKRISVTTLINAPRQRLLAVRHWKELEEDVSNHLWRILGSATHYILQHSETQHRLVEEKITHQIDDITIVTKLDLYDDTTKGIEDWKITSVWSFKFGDKIEWERQLNCYAWALRKAGYEVNKISINAILRDWSKGESFKYNDYPPIPFQKVEVKLWSFEEQEKYIQERVLLHKSLLEVADKELPLCTEEERWHKDDSYAVYKNNNKTATRVFNSETKAKLFILEIGKTKDKYRIEKRIGIDIKCIDYCSCNKFCDYWKEHYENQKSR